MRFKTKNINIASIDSYEIAMKYCKVRHPTTLNVRGNNDGDDFFDLDEEDVERIQQVLDESDDDDDDADDVQVVPEDGSVFPMPKKSTRKDLN